MYSSDEDLRAADVDTYERELLRRVDHQEELSLSELQEEMLGMTNEAHNRPDTPNLYKKDIIEHGENFDYVATDDLEDADLSPEDQFYADILLEAGGKMDIDEFINATYAISAEKCVQAFNNTLSRGDLQPQIVLRSEMEDENLTDFAREYIEYMMENGTTNMDEWEDGREQMQQSRREHEEEATEEFLQTLSRDSSSYDMEVVFTVPEDVSEDL